MDEGLKNLVIKAEQGDIDAMIMVGDCYNRGLHIEKNDKEAHKYYKMAADKGNVQASLMVAIDLLNGIGVKKKWGPNICRWQQTEERHLHSIYWHPCIRLER